MAAQHQGINAFFLVFVLLAMPAATVLGQQPLPGTVEPGQIERQFDEPLRPALPEDVIVPPVPWQQIPPEAETVRFALTKITIDGATVYSESDLIPYYQNLLGKEIALADVYRIANAITARYRNDGYILSQAIVPPQRINDGVIRLRAIEGYIDKVRIEGDVHGPRGLLEAYGNKIKRSRPLRSDVLERYLLLINDLGGTTARGTLSPSAEPGAADLTIVVLHDRLAGSASINNRGSRFLGPGRVDLAVDLFSVLGSYEHIGLRVVTTGFNNELHFAALSYEQPAGSEGARVGLSFSAVEAEPDLGANFAAIETRSRSAALTLSYPVIRSRTRNLYARGAFTYHNGETDANDVEFSEDRIRALRLAAIFDIADRWLGVNVFEVEASQGLDILGASDAGSPNLSRPGGQSDFTKLAFNAARLQSLPYRLSLLAAINAQYAFSDLLSPEEFAYGGEQFGRAYDASEIVGDSGAAMKLELRYGLPSRPSVESMVYGFYDIGGVWRHNPGSGEKTHESATSLGIGARLTFARRVGAYVEVAKPLTRSVNAEGNDDWRVFGAVSLAF